MGLFNKPTQELLASQISISNAELFRQSINVLKKKGLTPETKLAIQHAKSRARVQLFRTDISIRERKEFLKISRMTI